MINRAKFSDVQGFICKIAWHPTLMCNCNSRFIHQKNTSHISDYPASRGCVSCHAKSSLCQQPFKSIQKSGWINLKRGLFLFLTGLEHCECNFWQCLNTLQKSPKGVPRLSDVDNSMQKPRQFSTMFCALWLLDFWPLWYSWLFCFTFSDQEQLK